MSECLRISRINGAIFMKFGLAPTILSTFIEVAFFFVMLRFSGSNTSCLRHGAVQAFNP